MESLQGGRGFPGATTVRGAKPPPAYGRIVLQVGGVENIRSLSFATLCSVGEISSVRRSNISKVGVTNQGITRDHRQITRRLGPYAKVWASWLRRIAPGEATVLGRAVDREMGMAKLLQGTDRGEARWHASRRAGAAYLCWLGLPWGHLLWWGRWHSIKIAHLYASPLDEFECVQITRLPWLPMRQLGG